MNKHTKFQEINYIRLLISYNINYGTLKKIKIKLYYFFQTTERNGSIN